MYNVLLLSVGAQPETLQARVQEDALVVELTAGDVAAMLQASGFDGVAFDPVSFQFQQNGLAASEVDGG